jgi:hypothetical protein
MRFSHMLVLLVTAAPLCACGHSGSAVVGKVEAIQRNCGYTLTTTSYKGDTKTGRTSREAKMDCSEEPAFAKVRSGGSTKLMTGEADVFVRYKLPNDETAHSARVKVSASNRLFYSLEVGQELQVWIDPNDANKASL